jgi:predicted acyltransferase (DUF342 family)
MADEEFAQTFMVPDGTRMEEHTVVVKGDAIIGNRVNFGYGIIAGNIIIGERARVSGNVVANSDLRVDLWSKIEKSVQVKGDAYFGEFVSIDGRLAVEGNLDVGNNVRIKEGYRAKGWIVVRNPLPVITYIFLYLITLLQLGREEEVEKALEELFGEEEALLSENLMIVPDHSEVTLTDIVTSGRMVVGSDCRLFGNVKAKSFYMGDRNHLFGSIRVEENIFLGVGCTVHGKLESGGDVVISRGTRVMGDVEASRLTFHETARIDGTIHAPEGVVFLRDEVEGLPEEMHGIYYCFSLLFPQHSLEEQIGGWSVNGDALDTRYAD